MSDPEVERRFDAAMLRVYQDAKREAGYNATRCLQMLSENGGVETARRLLHSEEVSDDFTALYMAGRLDLTVEAHVLRPEYVELFTEPERSSREPAWNASAAGHDRIRKRRRPSSGSCVAIVGLEGQRAASLCCGPTARSRNAEFKTEPRRFAGTSRDVVDRARLNFER